MGASPKAEPRIATDLAIVQCSRWGERTAVLRPATLRGGGRWTSPGWRILRRFWAWDVVVTSDLRVGLMVGLVRRLLGRRTPAHIILEFRLDEPRRGLRWKLKRTLQRFAFSRVDIFFVSARSEARSYARRLGIDENRFRFLPYHTNIVEPKLEPGVDGSIFSGGRTDRHYRPLIEAAARLGEHSFVIVADRASMTGIEVPPNVQLETDVPYYRYRELLRRAEIVVVPLRPRVFSSGQVVILEAMGLGKPIITNRVVGTEDYVRDGENGVLLEALDTGSITRAIQQLIDSPSRRQTIAENGLRTVQEFHTFDRYVDVILSACDELHARARRS